MRGSFILGLGAQKAGTTWLHSELTRSPLADFGWAKEYHFLDSHTVDFCRPFFDRRVNAAKNLMTSKGPGDIFSKIHEKRIGFLSFLAFHSNPDHYFDYFSARLRNGKKVTGDLTPSNSLISSDTMKWVKSEFHERDVRCVAVFIMRDPVERFWSSIRMLRRKNSSYWSKVPEEDHVRQFLDRQDFFARGQYHETILAMEGCFKDHEKKIILYEEMTSNKKVFSDLCSFLCVQPYKPRMNEYENASPKSTMLSFDLMAEVAKRHAASYDAASSLFGKARLQSLWPSYNLIL
jgi:hypothetical protein